MLAHVKDRLFYGWVVVTGSFLFLAVGNGTRYSFGVFFKSIERDFSLGRAETSGIFSVYMFLASLLGALGGWALDRYGPRTIAILMGIFTGLSFLITSQAQSLWQLYISYSLLFAAGSGAGYVTAMATASRWFRKKRGLAVGIIGAGVGLGTLVMNPLSAYLIASFGWRVAFVVLGLIAVVVYISSALFLKKDPAQMGLLPDGAKPGIEPETDRDFQVKQTSFSVVQALRTRNFWLFSAIWLFWSFCLHLVLTHLVPHLTDTGISATDAALVAGAMGAVTMPGRIGFGWVADRLNRKATSVLCCLLQVGALLWLLWAQELWGFYLFAIVFSIGYGGLDPPTLALIGDIFGLRSIGSVMGALLIPWGLGAAIGPAVGGLIFDLSGSYSLAFLISAAGMMVSTTSVVLIKKERGRAD